MGLIRTKDLVLTAEIGDGAITDAKMNAAALVAWGLAAGYKVARGTASVTGTEVVATGLTTIVAAVAVARADPALTAYWVSCTWAGANLTLKVWKPTAANDVTPLAGTTALQVDWVAIGT